MAKPCVYDGVHDPLIDAPTHTHSDDIIEVWYGHTEPVYICGFHESRFSVPGAKQSPLASNGTPKEH